MNKIQVLGNSMVNQIAAGEVVERPLSVVKELVENAIDAGATEVSVEIKDGGLGSIRVTDNGCGIPAEQVRTAFLQHATSKIASVDDLERVLTMGFRGEALSSIAAVAQVEMVTKTAEQRTGIRIEIHGGEVVSETEAGTVDGTDITVRNLFYNVPARRKFLKKPATESGHIADICNKLALGNTSIAFRYTNNNSTLLQTKGNGDLKTVIYQIFGKEVADSLIELRYEKSGVRLSGYVGKPSVSRGNRSYSLTYINGRSVKSEIIQSAVEDAFQTRLMQNKFPLYVLRLNIDPQTVDVNVHPTKLEVRFSNEDMIYQSVYAGVEAALKSTSLIPPVTFEKRRISELIYNIPDEPKEGRGVTVSEEIDWSEPTREETTDMYIRPPSERKKPVIPLEPLVEQEQLPTTDAPNAFFTNYRIVGQVFNTYWLVEQGASVYLIDQHAAHERVLYEKLMQSLKADNGPDAGADSQRLVQPVIIPVNEAERQLIHDNMAFFTDCGFELEEFDPHSFVLYAVPNMLGKPTGAGFFIEILDKLNALGSQGQQSVREAAEETTAAKADAIAMIACKAAVKANDRLGPTEARALVEQVLKLENPFTCPHGRPTIVELSKTELEKLFKRIQP